MKVKTNELSGAALDWAVAKCEGVTVLPKMRGGCYVTLNKGETVLLCYSTNWAQGGPIIEREGISILYRVGVNMSANINGQYEQSVPYNQRGNAQLIVAMRCYVASKLGDEVEIPEELK